MSYDAFMASDIDMDYSRKVIDFINLEKVYPADLKRLPSIYDKDFRDLINSFRARKEYIAHLGFAPFSREFAHEIQSIFKKRNIETFAEIEAGNGGLTTLLNNIGVKGKGYTLDPDSIEHNWGIKKSPIFDFAVANKTLEFKDIRELVLDKIPDVVVASWIPYMAGNEVIDFFGNNPTVEYFMLIGEGHGGCTANDEFHSWLKETYDCIWVSRDYKPFIAIYDSVEIYQIKPEMVSRHANKINVSPFDEKLL